MPHGETDRLVNIERLDFSDGNLIYDLDSPNLGFVYRLYSAAFDRSPDEAGLYFWLDETDRLDQQGLNEIDKQLQIAKHLPGVPGIPSYSLVKTPPIMNMSTHVSERTERPPDQEGHDFWTMRLDQGTSRAEVLVLFSESLENRIATSDQFDEGVWVV